jgi:BirA family biotin operon repressor/biotin-[acetyl-CoA-carboxylase] ligase
MKKIYLNEIDSTQLYLIKLLKSRKIKPPVCIWSENQTNGIGSRGRKWIGEKGNLFFSFAYDINEFNFLPPQSLSIYFGFLFKKTLNNLGSKALLKWPNDIYLNKKIGGVITQIIDDYFVCGIGLNTKIATDGFESLDIEIKNDKILKDYFLFLEKKPSWDEIIEEYKKEFNLTKKRFNIIGKLLDDGSILQNNKKVYSKR